MCGDQAGEQALAPHRQGGLVVITPAGVMQWGLNGGTVGVLGPVVPERAESCLEEDRGSKGATRMGLRSAPGGA